MDFLFSLISPEHLADLLGEAFRADFVRMTCAFTAAAAMHRRWLKKDLAEHVKALTDGLASVAKGFQDHTERIGEHASKLDNHELRIGVLETDVGKLKTTTQGG